MLALPQSARRQYLWSSGRVERAVREATAARASGPRAVASVIAAHQLAGARQGQLAVAAMLAEQDVPTTAQATLLITAFTSPLSRSEAMLDQVRTDYEFGRIVASLVSDAGRSAESVATSVRPNTGYARYLSPPSCSRCAVLAGRVYRYSQGFARHPGCDCTMIPTAVGDDAFAQDPVDLMGRGLVTGMSKADRRAVNDGADFNLIVNTRRPSAGLSMPGRALARNGRPTPEAIYKVATSRDDAIERLIAAGYVR